MPLWNPAVVADYAATPLALLIVYFITCALTIGNYVGHFRVNTDEYGEGVVRAYLAFTILGTAAYVLLSGVMWIWAAKYSHTTQDRTNKLSYGVYIMLLLKDLPLFIIEYHAILCCGWLQPFQGFVFIIQFIMFIFAFVFAWLNFIWRASYVMEKYCGDGDHELKTGAENLVILPSGSPVEDWAREQGGILQFPQVPSPTMGTRGRSNSSYASPLMMQERESPNRYAPVLHSNPPSGSRRSQPQSQGYTPTTQNSSPNYNASYNDHSGRPMPRFPQQQYSAPNSPYSRGPISPASSRGRMDDEVQWDTFDSPPQVVAGSGGGMRARSNSTAQDFRSDAPRYVVEEYRYR